MKNFEYINRPFVNPASLEQLAKTYDTLEQGHLQALDAASTLETTLANLPLHSDESGWIQERINKINQLVDDNTIYGNSYGALDNLIYKGKKLVSDIAVKGRIEANKDFLAFQDKVRQSNLPEKFKEYYLKKNPYYYEDKIDEETGQVIGTTKWEPNETPSTHINNAIIWNEALKIAAKESGKGTSVRWLDANGNPTDNYTESATGQVFNTVTQQYERLPKEKIFEAINGVIKSIPEIKESLEQQFKIESWYHNEDLEKLQKDNPNAIIVDKTTDRNGTPVDFNTYIRNLFDPIAEVASYNNVYTDVHYGDALAAHRTAQRNIEAQQQAESYLDELGYTSTNTPVKMPYDVAGETLLRRDNAFKNINNLYYNITGKNLPIDNRNVNVEDLNNILDIAINDYIGKGGTAAQVANLRYAFKQNIRQFEEANTNYNNFINKVSDPDDKEKVDFINRYENGMPLNANNKYDAEFLNRFNRLKKEGIEYAVITIDNNDLYNNFINILNGDKIDGYKDLNYYTGTNKDGKRFFRLKLDKPEDFILFSNAVTNFSDKAGLRNVFNISVNALDKNRQLKSTNILGRELNDITTRYNTIKEDTDEIITKTAPTEISFRNENLPGQTFSQGRLNQLYSLGLIKEGQYNTTKKLLTDEEERKLIEANYPQVNIFGINGDNDSKFLTRINDTEDREKIGEKIKAAIGSNKIKYDAAYNPIYGAGLNVTIYPKLDDEGKPTGQSETYFIPNILSDKIAEQYESHPRIIASSKVAIANETLQSINLSSITDTPTTGNQQLQCLGGDTYIYQKGNKNYNLNKDEAVNITEVNTEYIQLKDSYQAGQINLQDTNNINKINEVIDKTASTISNITGENFESVRVSLINDLEK